ncbi:MAG TPA: gamma-glutamyl-gamma-aminobutyrate hydrolase family protein [Acidimicrobiia bacterium]|nr:gamma-glutamyl-gamma-aminobutyrate hydrolase family protein [Acidimicrobiia bacterium]
MTRPLIGITAGLRKVKSRIGLEPAHTVWPAYADMVRTAGGIPVSLLPGDTSEAPDLLERLDGILFSGGGDVDPSRYGGEIRPRVYGIDEVRDEFEIALALAAASARFPTLCICRGMQVMNVALGGTLIEDLEDDDPERMQHWVDGEEEAQDVQHEVAIEPGSMIAKALGTDHALVNSIHHQAVRSPGNGLVVTGTSHDGVIEAMEPTDTRWPMWAVQWHPELLGAGDAPSLRLFRALVDAAR